jgi:GGDEF domain-containing protein
LLVVNKQPFLVVHPTKNYQNGTLANALTFRLQQRGERWKIRFINRELAASAADELPTVSVSVGVARGTGASNWTELFKQADSVLYGVKQDGGRGCRVYHA